MLAITPGNRLDRVHSRHIYCDWASGHPLLEPIALTGSEFFGQFCPGGKKVVLIEAVSGPGAGGFSTRNSTCRSVRLLDVASGKLTALDIPAENGGIRVAFSADGRLLRTIVEPQHGTKRPPPKKGEVAGPRGPQGPHLPSLEEVEARIWDTETGKPCCDPLRVRILDRTGSLAMPTGEDELDVSRIVVYEKSPDGYAMRMWDLVQGAAITPSFGHGSETGLPLASFSRNGKRILTTVSDFRYAARARVWDSETGQPVSPLFSFATRADANALRQVWHVWATIVPIGRSASLFGK